ncbi:MAG: hypothetical protein IPQ07_07060 [Myxococcales bacterium]|nr:hypothetical protein [Myxococcales bacterium]
MSTVFGDALRRVRLATQLAVARSGVEMPPEAVDAARTELTSVTASLRKARGDHASPGAQLAAALQLSPDELEFVWAIVARAADPLLLGLLQVLCGTDARKGLSLAHYAAIMDLDDDRAQAITAVLSPSHPLRRYQFILGGEDQTIDACTPLTTPPRLWSFLRGEAELDELIVSAGGRIVVPHDPQLDEGQRQSVQRIVQGLGTLETGRGDRRSAPQAPAGARRSRSPREHPSVR